MKTNSKFGFFIFVLGIVLMQNAFSLIYEQTQNIKNNYKIFPITQNFSNLIIITPDNLYIYAKELADFYNNSINTEIYTTSEIGNLNFSELYINFDGYEDDSLPNWEKILNYEQQGKYNWTLAKKIRNFLSKKSPSYVILFGKAKFIPPSYYYFDKYYIEEDFYNTWIPTDIFYASFDNLTIKHSIGRILVDEENANLTVERIKNFKKNISSISLFGGKIVDYDDEYMGEISSLHLLENLKLNFTKFFQSDGNFTSSKLKDALKYDIVYHFGHGSGCYTCFSDDCILGNLNTNSSAIFVSVACMNGAFDMDIIPYCDKSFAESLLKNDVIAYVGGSRVNYGNAYVYSENGYITNYYTEYMNEILENFIKSNETTIGKAYIDSIENFKTKGDLRTIMEYVLLGSPLLNFKKEKINFPDENITINVGEIKNTTTSTAFGIYGKLPLFYVNETINILCNSSINGNVTIKIIDVSTDEIQGNGINAINFSPKNKGLYLIKCFNIDEKRFYFKVIDNKSYAKILNSGWSENLEDTNGNTLYDYLNFYVPVEIYEDGIYTIYGDIMISGIFVASASNKTFLKKGIHNVTLKFDGKAIRNKKMNGNFELNVKIKKDGEIIDKYAYYSSYYNYQKFESGKSSFINFSEIPEYGVNVSLDITEDGDYTITGYIVCNRSIVENITYKKYLKKGNQNVYIYFDKKLANNCKFNETKFSFKNVTLYKNFEQNDHRIVGFISKFSNLNTLCSKKGDVNNDGNVDIFDVIKILEYLSGEREKYELNFCGDFDNDYNVNLDDALKIMENINEI